MLEPDQITKTDAVPETIITEARETHIFNIDAKITSKHPPTTWDLENPPYWSDALAEHRLQRRRERALKKVLHNYQ